jgi:uncharacterized membrane protein
MDIGVTVAVWIHALSTVVVLGYYGILGRVVLPALRRALDGPALGRAVGAVERQALPILLLSVGLFVASGAYLLVIDEDFAGIGNYTDSTWTTLMLVKHVFVGIMVVGGIGFHVLAGEVADPDLDDAGRQRWLGYLRLTAEAMTGLGAIILLLTAAAQVG